MQNTQVRAVYQRGAFRPLEDVSKQFEEGQQVDLVIQQSEVNGEPAEPALSQAAQQTLAIVEQFYAGLSTDEIDAIEANMRRRLNFARKLDTPRMEQE
jgi:predicted DNA-binding antitoxin AbrB/MazE fold protein